MGLNFCLFFSPVRFDRDLGVAGRVIVRDEHDSHVKARLVKLDRPILRIPTLAIHLDRSETFQFNKETQLFPIAGLVEAELNRTGGGSKMKEEEEEDFCIFCNLKLRPQSTTPVARASNVRPGNRGFACLSEAWAAVLRRDGGETAIWIMAQIGAVGGGQINSPQTER
ncbi:hypothetical protein VTN31DRAFT_4684 [Thermomyces dupontii]|uniref:uncharacterized protein n=1 Tax=Talaromyces thermophilus TaxID=28565 RepID=UPI0037449ED8